MFNLNTYPSKSLSIIQAGLLLSLVFVLLYSDYAFSQPGPISAQPTSDKNYVFLRTFRIAGVSPYNLEYTVLTPDQEMQSIQYFDGFGRPVQLISVQGSPNRQDLVQHIEYDNRGRQSLSYGGYATTQQNGTFRSSAHAETKSFYQYPATGSGIQPTAYPYSHTVYEPSPIGRVLEQGAAGAAWQPQNGSIPNSGHTVKLVHSTNTSNEVRLWRTTGSSGADGTGHYSASKLIKTISKDENWVSGKAGTVEEFQDLNGRAVLKREWKSETEALDTYYVYDAYGNLRYVVPPAFTETTISESTTSFDQYVYAYRYDGRKRVTEKKLPGKGLEYIVYNKANQIVLTQDAVQRTKVTGQEWSYAKYDGLGRIVESGIHSSSYTGQGAAQLAADNHWNNPSIRWESRAALVYSNVSFPTTGLQPLMVNYYDDYSFEGASLLPYNGTVSKSTLTRTLATGAKVFKDDGTQPLYSVNYYDDKGNLIQSANQNHLGGTDILTNTYSFVGELLTSQHDHKASPSGTQTSILTTYVYDHVGRLLTTKKKVNGQAEIIQSQYVYNELGQLKEKKVHSEDLGTNFINKIDYAYNERGWTTKIGSPHFTEVLKYNDPAAGAVAQYNGNISEQHWDHGPTSAPSRFVYSYDQQNRLLNGTSTGTVMSETMSYDNMGNIQTLNRDGTTINYAYTGNRLSSLSGGLSGSYTYDANGNATTDRTDMSFGYNYLNQPRTATKSGTSVNYQYDAMGSKQRKIATAGSTTTQWDYIGGIEYEKVGSGASTIMMIHTEEGFLQNNGGTYVYHYNLTDHLGNVRATLKRNSATTGEIVQKDDYYPFGKRKFVMTSGVNHYLYNGKEIQDELGGQYDYGARFYDAEIGRWNVVDPMAELHYGRSAYGYVLNNPMLYTDPHGLDTLNYNNMNWGDYRPGEDHIALNEAYVNGSRSTWLWDNQLSSWEQRVAMLAAKLGVMQDGLGSLQSGGGFYDYLDAFNQLLPTTHVLNAFSFPLTGTDYRGNSISSLQASAGALSILPIGKVAGAALKGIGGIATKVGVRFPTRFVSTVNGLADLQPTLNRIASGTKFPHRNDGSVFKNLEGLLPKQNTGFYREFVHPIPGATGPGPMRVVTGQNGQMWFTADHYKTFIPIN